MLEIISKETKHDIWIHRISSLNEHSTRETRDIKASVGKRAPKLELQFKSVANIRANDVKVNVRSPVFFFKFFLF